MRTVAVLEGQNAPRLLEVPGMERLTTLSIRTKVMLAGGLGLLSLLLVGLIASHVVSTVKRQSDATDRAYSVLLELTAMMTAVEHIEHASRDTDLAPAARALAVDEGMRTISRSIVALQRLMPEDYPRRAILDRLLRRLQEKLAWLQAQGAGKADALAANEEDIEALAEELWQAEKAELERSKDVEQEGFRRIGGGAVIIGIVGCIPGVLLLLILRHDAMLHRRAAASLAQANAELDAIVRKRTEDLAAANTRLRELSVRIETAREQERREIAREVHDELGATLTALKIELAGSYGGGRVGTGERTRPRVRRAGTELVDAALQTVRNVLTALRPNLLDRYGLWEALRYKTGDLQQRMSIPCRLALGENLPELPTAQAIAVYRVVEEALTNVMRHSGATRVDVAARVEDGLLRVSVCDNGRGITAERLAMRQTYGVTSMMERATLLGGELRIDGPPDGGTRIWLDIPLVQMHERARA